MDQYLVFTSGDELLGMSIGYVDKIIEYKEPNKIPNHLSFVLGVFQYNDKILPLVDLTKKLYNLNFKETADTKVIVSYLEDEYIALVVDDIIGIKSFYKEEYEKNVGYEKLDSQYIEGFIKLREDRDDIILVLDIDKLFTKEELVYLDTNSEEAKRE